MSKAVIPCPHAKKCGGCQLQNLTYEEQLHKKQADLIHLLGRYGHVEEIIGMADPLHYRNKVQAAFRMQGGKVISGVYQSSTRRVVAVEECLLEDREAAPILRTLRKLCASFKIRPYDIATGKGFLRHVLIRRGFATGEIMVVLVTAKGSFPAARSLVNELRRRHPAITTVVWNVNPTDTPLLLGKQSTVLYGDGTITDILCGLRFRISPRSFYQVNPVQTEILYRTAKAYAGLTGKERVIDAYCGTGTIGLTLADAARSVIGVEVNRDAVADATANAALNGISNTTFIAADAGRFMEEMAASGERADVVITDPPRAGCSPAFLRSLLALSPERVVYISCNPETLARDLYTLTKGGYRVTRIQPVDLFPFTGHVETVVCLYRQVNTHHMKLHADPFDMIKSGEKTIELRLFDDKRQKIKAGDRIIFSHTVTGESITRTVVKLHRFDSFSQLYRSLPLLRCGYTEADVQTAKPSDMSQYYSAEDEAKFGVVGIEISPMEPPNR